MKNTAIAIYGPAVQRKSSTIKEIARQLELAFPALVKHIINDGIDITYVLDINSVKIGIESQGDPNSRQPRSLKHFVSLGCNIIICASRTTGMTVDAVNELHSLHGYDIIWSTNHRSWEKSQLQLNQISAAQIVDLVRLIISGTL